MAEAVGAAVKKPWKCWTDLSWRGMKATRREPIWEAQQTRKRVHGRQGNIHKNLYKQGFVFGLAGKAEHVAKKFQQHLTIPAANEENAASSHALQWRSSIQKRPLTTHNHKHTAGS
ncbi:hypothetical protein ATANTOWER_016651 [Ataeniobius toweri]|uniref:Uncharacterized protein n=1 Tax=Ataeniobius toweri TaxID=208326 RepID=A0ABU7B7Z6_9TELE|nr:hypothetical protein [Ataeniobius toweri]